MSRYGLRTRLNGSANANSIGSWFGGKPLESITIDYLVVAGGGGGGSGGNASGGAGAGGLRSTVTATGGGGLVVAAGVVVTHLAVQVLVVCAQQ